MTQLGLPIVLPFLSPSTASRRISFLGPSPIKDNCIVKTTVPIMKTVGLWTEKQTIKLSPLPITIITRIHIYLFQSFGFYNF